MLRPEPCPVTLLPVSVSPYLLSLSHALAQPASLGLQEVPIGLDHVGTAPELVDQVNYNDDNDSHSYHQLMLRSHKWPGKCPSAGTGSPGIKLRLVKTLGKTLGKNIYILQCNSLHPCAQVQAALISNKGAQVQAEVLHVNEQGAYAAFEVEVPEGESPSMPEASPSSDPLPQPGADDLLPGTSVSSAGGIALTACHRTLRACHRTVTVLSFLSLKTNVFTEGPGFGTIKVSCTMHGGSARMVLHAWWCMHHPAAEHQGSLTPCLLPNSPNCRSVTGWRLSWRHLPRGRTKRIMFAC